MSAPFIAFSANSGGVIDRGSGLRIVSEDVPGVVILVAFRERDRCFPADDRDERRVVNFGFPIHEETDGHLFLQGCGFRKNPANGFCLSGFGSGF